MQQRASALPPYRCSFYFILRFYLSLNTESTFYRSYMKKTISSLHLVFIFLRCCVVAYKNTTKGLFQKWAPEEVALEGQRPVLPQRGQAVRANLTVCQAEILRPQP